MDGGERTYEELAASEARTRQLVESAPAPLAMFDRDMRYLLVSDQYASSYRLAQSDLVGRLHTDVFPEIPDRWKAIWKRCLEGAIEKCDEDPFPRADGTLDWVKWEMRPWRDGTGAVGGLILISEVITERKRATVALQESEERFRAIFEHAPVGMAELEGADGRVVRVNDRLAAMLGSPSAELTGQDLTHHLVPEDRAALANDVTVARTRADLAPPAREVRMMRAGGGTILARVTLSCLHGPNDGLIVSVEDITTRRAAESAAMAAEHRWATTVRESPLATFVTAADSAEFLDVNPAFERLYGWTREEALGGKVRAPDLWADPARRKEIAERIKAEGRVTLDRLAVRTRDGEERMVAGNAAIVTIAGRICFISVVQDVTEKHQAEAELQRQQELIRNAFDKAPVGIAFAVPAEMRFQMVNQRLCDVLGYTQEELLSRSILDFTHPDDRERDRRAMVELGRGEITERRFHKRFVRKDGSIAECEAHVVASPAANGAPVRAVIAIDDVTAFRRAERELAVSETRYRELVDQLEEPILVTDREGVITFANRAFTRFGYEPEALVGTRGERLFPEEDGAPWRLFSDVASDATLAAGGAPVEQMLRDASGKPRPVRHRRKPIVRDGAVVGLTCVITDLTAQRETEEQLRAAQRMEAVGRLAAGIAHDFNNLLTVILSYSEITQSELPEDSSLQSCLDEVLLAGKRAEGLTKQLLAFSRRQLMELEPLSISETVHGVGGMLRRLIGEDVSLQISLATDLPLIVADRGQLEQVLMNLAINSRDAMTDGGRIVIASRARELDANAAAALRVAPGSYVEMSVTDNGSGMSEGTRARVFEPFFTTKAVGKGTGLGLSTVYGIVQQLGGGIAVESELGKGSTFRVVLPTSKIPTTAPPVPGRTGSIRVSRGNECVLVVEDEAAVRRVLQRLISKAGYRVIMTATPEEALAACKKHGAMIDLVMTDVIMPGMNGRELARRIEAMLPGVRVVYMSGYTDEAIERYDVPRGRFLRKPFELTELTRILHDAIATS